MSELLHLEKEIQFSKNMKYLSGTRLIIRHGHTSLKV